MGQLTFTEENVKKNDFDFPKLKLEEGERARITIVENPYAEYVHNIKKPVLEDDGSISYETAKTKAGKSYNKMVTAFVSNPICLGTEAVLKADGSDPKNCPMCARAKDNKEFLPKRRFAMHVIRTLTKPKSFDPATSGGAELLIWAYTDNRFNEIFELKKQWDFSKHDLLLGPCEDATYQKYKIGIAPETFLDEKARAEYFAEENRASDPTIFTGARKSRALVEQDLEVVDEVFAAAKGSTSAPVSAGRDLGKGISALLDEDDTTTGAVTEKADEAPADDADVDSFEGLVGKDEEGWAKEAPADEASAEKPKASVSGDEELDDLLNNL